YSFRLLDPAQQRELSLDQTVEGTLTPGVRAEVFRISGPAGQKLRFASTFAAANAGMGSWTLLGPDNQPLGTTDPMGDLDLTLPATGEYRLVLSGTNTAGPVGYKFRVLSQ